VFLELPVTQLATNGKEGGKEEISLCACLQRKVKAIRRKTRLSAQRRRLFSNVPGIPSVVSTCDYFDDAELLYRGYPRSQEPITKT
jgi:hypothetical protein